MAFIRYSRASRQDKHVNTEILTNGKLAKNTNYCSASRKWNFMNFLMNTEYKIFQKIKVILILITIKKHLDTRPKTIKN